MTATLTGDTAPHHRARRHRAGAAVAEVKKLDEATSMARRETCCFRRTRWRRRARLWRARKEGAGGGAGRVPPGYGRLERHRKTAPWWRSSGLLAGLGGDQLNARAPVARLKLASRGNYPAGIHGMDAGVRWRAFVPDELRALRSFPREYARQGFEFVSAFFLSAPGDLRRRFADATGHRQRGRGRKADGDAVRRRGDPYRSGHRSVAPDRSSVCAVGALVYFCGLVPGRYYAEYGIFVVRRPGRSSVRVTPT